MKRIGVLGAGTWGIALARMLCLAGHGVTVWSALREEIRTLSEKRQHPNLPGMEIPSQIRFTEQIEEACRGMDVVLFAVPSVYVRATAKQAAPFLEDGQIVVDVAKGIEADTLFTMTQVIADAVGNPKVHLVALSGPTHAEEVARDLPTTIVAACPEPAVAQAVQQIFGNSCMRVYTNRDTVGVELCGALKNIIALACGIATGLGYGDNTRAALITRGMTEIARLGTAMGCREQTFGGLAGIGDLIVTATSMHSRNNRCGILLGQGAAVDAAVKQVGMVVEGIHALPAAMRLAEIYGVDLPIIQAVDAVVNGGAAAKDTVAMLMGRDQKPELPPAALENDYN